MRAKTRRAAMELLDRIRALNTLTPEPVTSKWKTSNTWAELWGVPMHRAQKEIVIAVRAGLMVREMRVGRAGKGKIRTMPHYAEK